MLLVNFWREIILVLLAIALFSVWSIYSGMVERRDNTIATLTAESKVLEIQKDALIVGVKIQNDEIEKQRIDAVQRAEVFKMKSQSINAKFEAYKARMSDLNDSEECDEIKRLIEEAV